PRVLRPVQPEHQSAKFAVERFVSPGPGIAGWAASSSCSEIRRGRVASVSTRERFAYESDRVLADATRARSSNIAVVIARLAGIANTCALSQNCESDWHFQCTALPLEDTSTHDTRRREQLTFTSQ